MRSFSQLTLAFLFVTVSSSLFAYQPGKWTPMDRYIESDMPGGPTALSVTDRTGKLVTRAAFSYSPAGRLMKEEYFDAKGTKTGETTYRYAEGKIVEELVLDAQGKVITTKTFQYNRDGLSAIVIVENNQEVMRITYTYRNAKPIEGMEGLAGDQNHFSFEYRAEVLEGIEVKNTRGESISHITYRYQNSRLTEREKIQDSRRSRCQYTYSSEGRLTSFAYSDLQGTEWVLDKTFTFQY